MRKLWLFLFIATSCSKVEYQECNYINDYYQLMYEADYNFEVGNYENAYTLYQRIFSVCEPINTPGYNEIRNFAEICAILGNNEVSIQFLKRQIDAGYEITTLLNNPSFENVFKSEEGKTFLAELESYRINSRKILNLELREDIKSMMYYDQKYRMNNYSDNMLKQDSLDNINTIKLINIFDKYGFPNDAMIGSFIIDRHPVNVNAILLHTSDSIRMNYFVPKLREFVINGECHPQLLGNLIDQYQLYNSQPQIFGTYLDSDGNITNLSTPIEEVDKMRISIGLPTLQMAAKKDSLRNIQWQHVLKVTTNNAF